jgi:predicted XRE-type DNA-binding protein
VSSKTPEDVVLEIVKNYPGLTGQEIAKKAFQNYLITYNILIEKLKGRCYKDENYGWHLLNQSDQSNKTKVSLKTKVLKIIGESNGIKAKDIASKLGLERSLVNSLLYGSLKDQCEIDSAFFWRLRDGKIKEKNATRLNSQTNHEIIAKAVNEHREVTISYKGFSRTIHPYTVNSTYCVAYCTYRSDLRTFRLDRMKNIKLGEEFSVNSAYINKSDSQIENANNFRKFY